MNDQTRDLQDAAKILLQESIALVKEGNKVEARKRIRRAAMLDPTNEALWLCMTGYAESADEANQALRQVQALNPTHPQLVRAQTWVKERWPQSTTPAAETSTKENASTFTSKILLSIAFGSLGILVGVMLLTLTLSEATATNLISVIVATPTPTQAQKLTLLQQEVDLAKVATDRMAMIAGLTKMWELAPDNAQTVDELAELYYEQGIEQRDANLLDLAQQSFEQALAVKPDFPAAEKEARLATHYLTGIDFYQNAGWAAAVESFVPMYEQDPSYLYVDEILYSAYYNLGIVQEETEELSTALESYRKAVEILPNIPEAKLKVEEINLKLNPPTPEPTTESVSVTEPKATPEVVIEKRIVVDISDQRTYLYENDELVNEFVVSTGEPGRDTAIGEFEIQSKIPMAYASTWNLDMPFWLGIYWSGPLENGFHALPTVRDTGVTMWDGYLGQRVSYGCIVLGMEEAETLYNWVEMGTSVSIVP